MTSSMEPEPSSYASTLKLPEPGQAFSLPLASPDRTVSEPAQRAEPTREQQEQVERIIGYLNKPNFVLPTTLATLKQVWRVREGQRSFFGLGSHHQQSDEQANEMQALQDREKMYLSLEQVHRACRAVKWDEAQAIKRLEEIVVWRREYGVEDMQPQLVSKEGETGKELVFGYDKQCRPVLYMHPYRQNTETGPRQIDFVIWTLERTIDLCPATSPATEMLCLCIDFGASLKVKAPPTSLGQAKKVLDILQLVGPFVDPRTKEKIRFLDKPDATDLIPAHQLQKQFGGDVDFQYNHEEYFPALHKLCMERRTANLERWRQYGDNKCGLSETIIRGAVIPGNDQQSPTDSKTDQQEQQHSTTVEKEESEQPEHPSSKTTSTATTVTGDDDDVIVPSSDVANLKLNTTTTTDLSDNKKEVFVDAPIASEEAVKVAVPAAAA
ncbi:Phosphatidylinositol transfer protein (PITP) [Microbotryomycetes sp. JL221]|nr:Phosphatidylinositol transfer protein (PITP) [Microbotryomycetes sp. JL221]